MIQAAGSTGASPVQTLLYPKVWIARERALSATSCLAKLWPVKTLHEMVGTESSGAGGAAPGGGQPPFDFSALQNVLADPSIKQMAEQIASAPEFAQMTQAHSDCAGACKVSVCSLVSPPQQELSQARRTQALQASMANGGAPAGGMPGGPARGGPALDPEAYANAMTGVLQNPQFMQMAEQLGQQIMTVRGRELLSALLGELTSSLRVSDAWMCAALSKTRVWRR